MLLEEFIPFCEERLGLDDPARGLLGWSMGGYGALLAAERRPELFRAVVAVSPALWRTQAEQASAAPDAFDDAADYARNDVYAGVDRLAVRNMRPCARSAGHAQGVCSNSLDLAVRIDCGANDPFRAATEAFRARFDPPPSGGIQPGVHNLNTWQRFAPAEIDFLGTSLA
jgi:S-formylglutathione hydrolase FrmB